MVADVGNILNAAQRARLLSMQKTAGQLGVASARLATGQKVSSALDNPGSFFLARALRNRAGDLSRLLDGIGQSIRVIEEADNGIRAAHKILDLAESYLLDIEKKYLAGEVGAGTGPALNETFVTFNGAADFTPYAATQDIGPATINSPASNQVDFDGNLWKRKAFNYNVTADTVLTFEYQSTLQPDISAIGFDNDTLFTNDNDRFFIYGSQTTGVNYSASAGSFDYSGSGTWEQIEIPIGTFFTGNYSYLTFIHDDDAAPFGNASFRNMVLREGAKQLPPGDGAAFEKSYAAILNQLDLLVKDAQYRGINLLKDDDLTTFFNETNTSKLVTEGINATYAGLGLQVNDFNSLDAVREKILQVRAARKTLRDYAASLSNDLNIIKIRDEFTNGQVNGLKSGADGLTLADPNEEGAKLLALQTRQQLQSIMMAFRQPNILSVLA